MSLLEFGLFVAGCLTGIVASTVYLCWPDKPTKVNPFDAPDISPEIRRQICTAIKRDMRKGK